MSSCNRYIVGRERNVVHVDFSSMREPLAPKFPGASALRRRARYSRPLDALARTCPERVTTRESNIWAIWN
jgi:hypothetical protein